MPISPSTLVFAATVAPLDYTVTSTTVRDKDNIVSWTHSSSAMVGGRGSMTVTSTGFPLMVSSLRIWPAMALATHPSSFSIGGSTSVNGPFTEIYSTTNAQYTSNTWTQFDRMTQASQFSSYTITVNGAQSYPIYLNEIHFLVCNRPVPTTFSYPEASYSLYRYYQQVNILPTTPGLTSCTVSPLLPEGLTLDASTCAISGVATAVTPQTTYTVTSNGEYTCTATLTITTMDCASLYKIVRTYLFNPQMESFRIRDSSNDQVIYEVNTGHNHPATEEWTHLLCITQDHFDLTLYHTSSNWVQNSYISIYYLISQSEEEMILKARYDSIQGNDAN